MLNKICCLHTQTIYFPLTDHCHWQVCLLCCLSLTCCLPLTCCLSPKRQHFVTLGTTCVRFSSYFFHKLRSPELELISVKTHKQCLTKLQTSYRLRNHFICALKVLNLLNNLNLLDNFINNNAKHRLKQSSLCVNKVWVDINILRW